MPLKNSLEYSVESSILVTDFVQSSDHKMITELFFTEFFSKRLYLYFPWWPNWNNINGHDVVNITEVLVLVSFYLEMQDVIC
jgi:hypothetical protein